MTASPSDEAVTRLTVAYDGKDFAGWAAQPGLRTVQGELERALATVLRRPVALTVAGRTDRGVHATGQVCSFSGPPPERLRSVNAVAAPDVSVLDCAVMPPGWSARFSAVARAYVYRVDRAPHGPSPLLRDRALWWPHAVDVGALSACADALVGTRDFTAFTPTDSYHVRFSRDVFRASWSVDSEGTLVFAIEADAFMRNMIRVLVGTQLEVAAGRRTMADFERLLRGAPRAEAGPTAPAHGLCLTGVRY